MKRYEYSLEKNSDLKKRHGISIEEIVIAISKGKLVKIITHPNQKRYPRQMIILVEISGYIYAAPFVEDKEKRFIKTVYPSRKFTKTIRNERIK